jgi:ATP-binding cassette subfamily B protein
LLPALRWLWQSLRPRWAAWLVVALLVVLQAVSHLATPVFYKLIFDRIIAQGDAGFFAVLVAGMGAVFVVMVLAEVAQGTFVARLAVRTINDLRSRLFAHFQNLPVEFFDRSRSGDLLAHFTGDLDVVDRVVSVSFHKVALNALVAALCTGALFVVEWRLALFALVVLPLIVLLPRAFGARGVAVAYERRQGDARIAAAVQESLAAQRVIRAYGLQSHQRSAFGDVLRAAGEAGLRANLYNAYLEKSTNLGLILGQLLIIGVGAWLATRGDLTAGDLAAFAGFLINASGAVTALTAFAPDLVQAAGSLRRVGAVLVEPVAEPDNGDDGRPPARFSDAIRFRDVSFRYGEKQALEGVSFTIRAGESVAFVGRSGSGKSTIVNLLMRFQDASAGTITVDGTDIRAISRSSLRRQIGSVFQSTFLFDVSVMENIRMGRLDASDAEVKAAARAAALEEAILEQPGGYGMQVGEGGRRLSGGQQQRLALARALLRDPPILVLDEATSALDSQTEAAVNATLDRLSRGRTRISVTHRLAAAAGMDRILVLEQGRLIEEGTHSELLARGSVYAALWEKQNRFAVDPSGTQASLDAMFLRMIPLFASLNDDLLAATAKRFQSVLCEPGETLISQGEAGDAFYVIVRGRVEVSRDSKSWILEEGDFFGEIALLAEVPRSATVHALGRCLLLTMTGATFRSLMDEMPQLREQLEKGMRRRLDDAGALTPSGWPAGAGRESRQD